MASAVNPEPKIGPNTLTKVTVAVNNVLILHADINRGLIVSQHVPIIVETDMSTADGVVMLT